MSPNSSKPHNGNLWPATSEQIKLYMRQSALLAAVSQRRYKNTTGCSKKEMAKPSGEQNVHLHGAGEEEGAVWPEQSCYLELPHAYQHTFDQHSNPQGFFLRYVAPGLILTPLELSAIPVTSPFFTATRSRDQANRYLSQPGMLQASAFCHFLCTKV